MSTHPVGINWHDETTRRFIVGRVARPAPGDPRRRCFYVDDVNRDEHGIIPMLVIEGEPGYRPMLGENPSGTWHWGQDLQEAQTICDLVNSELFGLSRDEAHGLVGASMRAQEDTPDPHALTGECPVCMRRRPWTDGRSVAAGDPVDEYWCQVCGAESPLAACDPRPIDASATR